MFTLSDTRINDMVALLRAFDMRADQLRELVEVARAKRLDGPSYATMAVAADTLLREVL